MSWWYNEDCYADVKVSEDKMINVCINGANGALNYSIYSQMQVLGVLWNISYELHVRMILSTNK